MSRHNSTECNDMLLITPDEMRQALQKIKPGKGEGEGDLTSDHLIHAGDVLCGHLSVLFLSMLKHGFFPHGMLVETMVPLLQGHWANVDNSENFSAIILSSLISKL